MPKRIWVISDIHGSYLPIENFWKRNKNEINFSKDKDIIIITGDAGCLYYLNKKDDKFKSKLEKFPFTYFIIRGNHEERASVCAKNNPDQWKKELFWCNIVLVEKKFPDIKYANDIPTLYFTGKYDIFTVPGAYSVDKYYRIRKNWAWFPQEQLTPEEMEEGRRALATRDYQVDIILSHTAPLAYEPKDLFLPKVNQKEVDKTMETYLGEIEYKTDYTLFLFGHFHSHRIFPKNGNKQCIMIYNEKVFNLSEYMESIEPYKTY